MTGRAHGARPTRAATHYCSSLCNNLVGLAPPPLGPPPSARHTLGLATSAIDWPADLRPRWACCLASAAEHKKATIWREAAPTEQPVDAALDLLWSQSVRKHQFRADRSLALSLSFYSLPPPVQIAFDFGAQPFCDLLARSSARKPLSLSLASSRVHWPAGGANEAARLMAFQPTVASDVCNFHSFRSIPRASSTEFEGRGFLQRVSWRFLRKTLLAPLWRS